jgi:alpha-ketoglutarate-dependent taurine dioxygenase
MLTLKVARVSIWEQSNVPSRPDTNAVSLRFIELCCRSKSQEQPKFVYEHVWGPADILMWDNRCTLHARTDFFAGERRLLRRVTILGEKPV